MSKTIEITFDRTSADWVLNLFQEGPAYCHGCNKVVTGSSLGAIQKIDGAFTIWHNKLGCLLEYVHLLESSKLREDSTE